MTEKKSHRFIIGIGSQRAGSTLLHRLLEASSEIFMHPIKELHYFDTLYGYRSQQALQDFSTRQLMREIDHIISSKNLNFVKNNRYKCYLRANKLLAKTSIEKIDYLDLFRPNLQNNFLLGEVTPEYMLFDEKSVEKMQKVIGENAGIILICRNPVKRILSAVKLMNSYNNLNMDNEKANKWIQQMFDSENFWIKAQDRYNDYQKTINLYSKIFPNFLAISYDELINNPKDVAEKISSNFSIKINLDVFERESLFVANDLGENFSFFSETIKNIEKRYQKNMHFITEYFGFDLIK